jgi:hypothetical protein
VRIPYVVAGYCRVKPLRRVELFGNAALNGRYISSKAKYWPETDSAQVE